MLDWKALTLRVLIVGGVAMVLYENLSGRLALPAPPLWVQALALVLLVVVGSFAFVLAGGVTSRTGAGHPHVYDHPTRAWLRRGESLGAYPRHWAPRHDDDRPRGRAAERLVFRVPDDAPMGVVRAATRAGLKAAKGAAPGGTIRAQGTFEDVPGPESEVVVRLEVEGPRFGRREAEAAGRAFADAFRARLARKGVDARER